MESMNTMKILNKFFRLPGQSLKDFAEELRALSMEEKRELASLAAIELGVEYVG